MTLSADMQALSTWIEEVPRKVRPVIGENNSQMYTLDFIVLGAVKRSISLASGLLVLIKEKNMVCARAIVRMQLDTIARLFAYLYVDDAEQLAKEILGGAPLNKFKSNDGKLLKDGYLIDRLTEQFPWVKEVYKFTSGYVHFSERQFFDTVHSVGTDQERTVQLHIGKTDDKYPESSWGELPACFNHLNMILDEFLITYAKKKQERHVSGL